MAVLNGPIIPTFSSPDTWAVFVFLLYSAAGFNCPLVNDLKSISY